jgi:signal transduction histidine kinase
VKADAEQVGRALHNLIANAVEHAHEKVVVGADHLADFVAFSVADDGPGLPVQQQERLFEPFLDEGRGSAGLGLAITPFTLPRE